MLNVIFSRVTMRYWNGTVDESKEVRSNNRWKSTCIRASERGAVRAQLRSLKPTSQWAAGSQERRSGNP